MPSGQSSSKVEGLPGVQFITQTRAVMDYEVVGHISPLRTFFFFPKLGFSSVASENHSLETKGSLKPLFCCFLSGKAVSGTAGHTFLEGKLGTFTFDAHGFKVGDVGWEGKDSIIIILTAGSHCYRIQALSCKPQTGLFITGKEDFSNGY